MPAKSRRSFLAGSLAAAVAGSLARPSVLRASVPRFTSNPFVLGVASGYPTASGVVLWTRIVPIAKQAPDAVVTGLFVQSLNELIDLHAKRVTADVRNRIPLAIWMSLYGVTILSFAVLGYHAGLVSTRRSPAILPVAVTFAVVIWLIADLDRPQEGTLTLSQQALIDLRQSMGRP